MRKSDYTALADILKRTRRDAREAHVHANPDDMETRAVAAARHQAAEDVARDFARTASVDGPAFLKACGIP